MACAAAAAFMVVLGDIEDREKHSGEGEAAYGGIFLGQQIHDGRDQQDRQDQQ